MKHFLIAFVFLCTWLYFGIRYYECSVKNLCEVPTAPVVVEPPKVIVEKPLTYLPFSITKNIATVTVIDSTSNPLQTYFEYLNANQREELIITSFFNKDENGEVALLRGNKVKSILGNFGINADRLVLQTKRADFDFSGVGKFEKGFAYEYQTMSEERLKAIEKTIASKILYAGFGSKTFQPDNTLNTYSLELKNYLAKHPNKQVEIIGHTDSNGEAEGNQWIGNERAKSVMNYFVSQGIDASKLTISSEGETSPIATNTTAEGRQLNRRIEINVTN